MVVGIIYYFISTQVCSNEKTTIKLPLIVTFCYKEVRDQIPANFYRQSCIGVGSLAGYIGWGGNGRAINHASSWWGRVLLNSRRIIYLASDANKNKRNGGDLRL